MALLISSPAIDSRVRGCWLGKSIGGTLGLPAEGKKNRQAFSFYDPVPVVAPPNDDLELQLVWLDLIEKSGPSLSREDFARAWLENIHYMWDEYGRCRWNLRRGVPADAVGTYENWFQSSMGSPIRSEIWACLFPGDPVAAACYAELDASLDHGVEGIAGEAYFSALQSLVLGGSDVSDAVVEAMSFVPPDCELASALSLVLEHWKQGGEVWACREELLAAHGHENFTHAPLNVALTVWALAYGGRDFAESILLAVNGGYDTDCTAATVGAILGMACGDEGIPRRWADPIGDGVYLGAGIQRINAPRTLDELSNRTLAAQGRLVRRDSIDPPVRLQASPDQFAGAIALHPYGGGHPVPWANGELPKEVCAAGGAEWEWNISQTARRHLMVLARAGASLIIDGQETLCCPPGLDYVPAPSRSPEGSRCDLAADAGKHHVSLSLGSKNENQEASVILAYPNRHLAPWTADELPHKAFLPAPQTAPSHS